MKTVAKANAKGFRFERKGERSWREEEVRRRCSQEMRRYTKENARHPWCETKRV